MRPGGEGRQVTPPQTRAYRHHPADARVRTQEDWPAGPGRTAGALDQRDAIHSLRKSWNEGRAFTAVLLGGGHLGGGDGRPPRAVSLPGGCPLEADGLRVWPWPPRQAGCESMALSGSGPWGSRAAGPGIQYLFKT